jgi:hypothetical protein
MEQKTKIKTFLSTDYKYLYASRSGMYCLVSKSIRPLIVLQGNQVFEVSGFRDKLS